MAKKPLKITRPYPLPVYNYRVSIGKGVMSFSEVSGLAMEYEKVIYKHGFTYLTGLNIIRAQPKEVNITLKRGIVKEQAGLLDWIKSNKKIDVNIELCDETGKAVVSWRVIKALPLKLESPTFNAGSNEVAIEQMHLVANEVIIKYL